MKWSLLQEALGTSCCLDFPVLSVLCPEIVVLSAVVLGHVVVELVVDFSLVERKLRCIHDENLTVVKHGTRRQKQRGMLMSLCHMQWRSQRSARISGRDSWLSELYYNSFCTLFASTQIYDCSVRRELVSTFEGDDTKKTDRVQEKGNTQNTGVSPKQNGKYIYCGVDLLPASFLLACTASMQYTLSTVYCLLSAVYCFSLSSTRVVYCLVLFRTKAYPDCY